MGPVGELIRRSYLHVQVVLQKLGSAFVSLEFEAVRGRAGVAPPP